MKNLEKFTGSLFYVFVIVLSVCVLLYTVPDMGFMKHTVNSLEESEKTVMAFSGTAIATSVALSAFQDDFASPIANTISDLNIYLLFILAVIFVEKLIVVVGTKISLMYIIPIACLLYIAYIITTKEACKKFANKLMILGISVVLVIPISTYFTETVCAEYTAYVEETIAEAQAGADKINEAMTEDDDMTIFEKLSAAFQTAIQGVKDLLTYFEGVVKRCINAVAIMIVTSFVLPLIILMLFRWLLKELFALNIPDVGTMFTYCVKKARKVRELDFEDIELEDIAELFEREEADDE